MRAHYVGTALGPGIYSCEFETDHSHGTNSQVEDPKKIQRQDK